MCSCYKHHSRNHDLDYDWNKEHKKDSYKHCDKECSNHHHKHFENCVTEVLEAILEAQKKAKKDDHCKTSCSESIKDLLGERKKVMKNTIPIILFCSCEPFKGSGALTYSCHTKRKKFKCINTFIFKIKDIDKECAVLELLTFKSDHKQQADTHKKCCGNDACSPCCQIDHKCVDDLIKTGICINVDLSRFSAVTCLPAVHL